MKKITTLAFFTLIFFSSFSFATIRVYVTSDQYDAFVEAKKRMDIEAMDAMIKEFLSSNSDVKKEEEERVNVSQQEDSEQNQTEKKIDESNGSEEEKKARTLARLKAKEAKLRRERLRIARAQVKARE